MTLFDDLVSALQPTLRSVAPFILTRLLLRAGVFDREAMTTAELQHALPALEAGLLESLGPGDYASVIERVRDVLRRWQGVGAATSSR